MYDEQKGTLNTPQSIIYEIAAKHRNGATLKSLSEEYVKPLRQSKICSQERTTKNDVKKPVYHPLSNEGEKPRFRYKNTNMKANG